MFWFETDHPETGEWLEVEAEWSPSRRGLRDWFGAPLEPDDLEELIICRVWDRFGTAVPHVAFESILLAQARRIQNG